MHPNEGRPRHSGTYQDPGWTGLIKATLLPWRRRRWALAEGDGITTLRGLFLSLLVSGFLIGYVLVYIIEGPSSPPGSIRAWQGLVLLFGVSGFLLGRFSHRKPFAAGSEVELAGEYRTKFFLSFVGAESPLLIGFVGTMVTQSFLPYLTGLPFFVLGMALIAPSRGNLSRLQQRLIASGSALSITSALAQIPGSSDESSPDPPQAGASR